MSYAKKRLERDLARAFHRYYLRTAEVREADMDIVIDREVVNEDGSIDTENFRASDVEVSVESVSIQLSSVC